MPKNPFKTTRDEREEMRAGMDASSIGWFFFAAIGIGFVVGHLIDNKFHTDPWGGAIGAMLGVAAGFVNLVQVANRISRYEDEEDRRRKSGGPRQE